MPVAKKAKKKAEHKACDKIIKKDKTKQIQVLNKKWLP